MKPFTKQKRYVTIIYHRKYHKTRTTNQGTIKYTTVELITHILVMEMNGNMKPTYQKVTGRIIKAGLQVDKAHHMNVIVAYAPTLVKSEE